MTYITANGVQYYVEQSGSGPALLLLHGFTGSAATWAPHMAAWRDRYTCVAVDLLGHGQSDAPADPARYSMAATVADLSALLAALGIARTHLLGYSLGGRVALALAVAQPAYIGGLVLESASPGLATATERAARIAADEALAASIERDGVPAFVDRWEALPLWVSQAALPAASRAALHTQRLQNRAGGLANSLRGLSTGAQPPLHDQLDRLQVPTLCLAGTFDAKFVALAEDLTVALPQAQLALIPGAGHATHLEQPDAFHQTVSNFLSQPAIAGLVPAAAQSVPAH
ncbi:MAG: 2-succinyl-6-hydroxy-2,4-cyclohexadiene-1-carboxylate synthase [Chloroflexota bacterium]|nr:2-succinyl-6-hydroxy-2,4-cyclohexadiene-1-carboxylate synthase [Chloroflexota bacterium]